MASFAIIEFGLLIIALVLTWLHVNWLKNRKGRVSTEEQLNSMFNHEWNGKDEDEIYAWYRVRFKVMQLENDGSRRNQKLERIEAYIRRLSSRPMRSAAYVTQKGELENAGDNNDPGLGVFTS
ncbi:MAG: hypothetical protein LAT75_02310 [Candidatus Cyclonatronum sp.]|uniref:hypothetical protein n=1 Tax=Cyclonatronum sp. TaxID=3024185 RepID=UPI0025C07CE5|nr:hypothetical protein [Cyclonatronum sp.]MCC5934277.1 hypothetical protein [Balneolales bacterium]MCH8485668.1 hypothetical protein [Cyclonatronum sp.]